jgi:hypothetical protein
MIGAISDFLGLLVQVLDLGVQLIVGGLVDLING